MTYVKIFAILLPVSELSERAALAQIEHRLRVEFPDAAPGVIDAAVTQAHAEFDSSRIREFVPLFVEKHARQQLLS